MGILNITNLTNNPEKTITDNYLNAFEEVEKELNVKKSDSEKYDFIDNKITELEEQMEEAQGKDLLGIIDNYIVNLDYYTEVKEWLREEIN